MGGLRLGVPGEAPVCKLSARDFRTTALTTRQFAYLRKTASPAIQATPKISEEEIKDKSKTDCFSKGPQFNHIHNGNFELSKGHMQPISLWLTAAVMTFGAIHLSAWNFIFPTKRRENPMEDWRHSDNSSSSLLLAEQQYLERRACIGR